MMGYTHARKNERFMKAESIRRDGTEWQRFLLHFVQFS